MNLEIIQTQLYLVFKILMAAVFGGCIGYFRREKRAGIRTISLISMGSALFTMISIGFLWGDPGRVTAGIVTGIGFLGAGVIWKDHKLIGGITTASAIWVASAIGVCVALDMWIVASFTVILGVLILTSKLDPKYE